MRILPQLQCRTQLALTPSLKQAISLLALPYRDFVEHIERECADNHLIELRRATPSADNDFLAQVADSHQLTMASYLEESVLGSSLEPAVKNIFLSLIEMIDEYGFLPIAYRQSLSPQLQKQYIQWASQLEPTGLGASDLYESLLWQLEKEPHSPEQVSLRDFLEKVRQQELSWHDKPSFFSALEKTYPNIIKQVDKLFQKLELYPARRFESQVSQDLQAELLLVEYQGAYQVELNEELVCYIDLSPPKSKEEEPLYQQGQSFRKMVKTRYQTLLDVARFLVSAQQDFFRQGRCALKPMQLKDIASALSLHESTISRVAQSKYIWTDAGFVPLKVLFARKLNHDDYGAVSSSHVQACLKSLLHYEDKTCPFSDQQLQDILHKQGYQLARRTIAKYRERLGFQNSRQRRLRT